jgi:hypothetical protein
LIFNPFRVQFPTVRLKRLLFGTAKTAGICPGQGGLFLVAIKNSPAQGGAVFPGSAGVVSEMSIFKYFKDLRIDS